VRTAVAERPVAGVLNLIGRTPLVRLHRFERDVPAGVELYAKAEWQNPGGSVKDRAAASMILDGEARGVLTPGKTILDATSGNTGIAYAMVGAAKGYRVKLCVPDNASPERKLILRALGAELVLTDPLEGTDGAIREARRLYADDPDRYFYPDQYNNDANWRAHYDTICVFQPSARTPWCAGWRARKGCSSASRPERRSPPRSTLRVGSTRASS
jgi:cysteine synthase B